MTSDQECFDAEKVRHEIFQAGNRNVYMTIEFVGGTARILEEKGRLQDFEFLADRSIELLQGNLKLQKELLSEIVKCDVEFQNANMIKYYLEFGKLLNDSIDEKEQKINIFKQIGKVYYRTAHYRKSLEYALTAINIACEVKNKNEEDSCCLLIGIAYYRLSEYEKAIEYLQKGLAISTEIGDQAGIACSTCNLGLVYYSLGEFENAISYHEKSHAILTEIGDQSGIASNAGNLGNVYYRLGGYEKAISCFERGLAMSNEIGYQTGIASNTGNLGGVYFSLGKYEKAISYYEKSLAVNTEIGDRPGIATCTGNLGNIYKRLGDVQKAIMCYENGLEICTEIGDQSGIARNNGNLGTAYHSLGKYEEAIRCHEKGLAISVEIGDQLGIASNTSNLGNAYSCLGEYGKAISCHEKGLAISNEIGDCSGIASNIGNLGNAYLNIGEYEKAVSFLEKGLAISTEIQVQSGIAINAGNLGIAYYSLGEYGKAITFYEKGLAISSEIGDRLAMVANSKNLGNAYCSLGEYEKAISYYEKGLAISTEIGNQSGIASNTANLGMAYLKLRDYEKAINFYNKGLKIGEEIGDPRMESLCVGNIGAAYFLKGRSNMDDKNKPETLSQFQQVVSYLKRSVNCMDKIFSSLDIDQNKISFTGEYYVRYVTLMCCFILLERSEAALLVIDLGKAKALHVCIAKQKKSESDDMLLYSRKIWERIDNKNEKMETEEFKRTLKLTADGSCVLLFSFDLDKFLNIWVLNGEGDITTFKRSETLNELGIFHSLKELFSHFNVNLTRDSSFHKLDSDSTLGWQIVSQDQLNGKPVKDKPVDPEKTPSQKRQSADECTLSKNTSKVAVPSESVLKTLHEVLIQPVKNAIKGTKLIIVPDKILFFVPFCSLEDENSCRVSENYSIQITPSLHTLVSSMTRPRDPSLGFALFVGNPTVGKVRFRGEEIVPRVLPSATEEVKCLAPLFDAKPLVESEATKERVLKFIQGASVIHIAAHGERDRGEILLAPNPNVTEQSSYLPKEASYLLKQQDILNINVNARLVVLCCCHTGKGKISSEGVIGLTRAFLAAGARSVLATLWPIHDKATKEFMEIFYGEIFKETSVCEALRRTMNMFQDHQNKEFCSFNIWAPFTIYGEDVKFTQHDIEQIKEKSRAMYS